jgi:MFS family permease
LYGRYTVALLTLAFTVSYADRHVLSLLVNPVQVSLQLSDTQMGLIQGAAFSIFYVLAALPLARLSDNYNRPRILGWCISLWSGMTMICGLTTSFWQLMVARIGVASGEAGLPPAALTLMADSFDRRRLARATSFFMLAPFLGGGLALIGGGALYELTASWTMPTLPWGSVLQRWQLIFMLVGAPGFLVACTVWLTLKEPRRERARSEPKASLQPLRNFLLGNWRFSILYMIAIALVVMLFNAHIAWMPAAIVRAHHVGEGFMGMVFGPTYMLSGAIGSLAAGWFIARGKDDLLGRTLVAMRFAVLALMLPAIAAPIAPVLTATIALIGISVFFASGVNGMSTLVLQYSAPLRQRAQALAVLSLTSALIGTGMGPLVVGVLSDALAGHVAQPLSVALSLLALVVAPISCVLLQVVIRQHRRLRLDLLQIDSA